MDQTRSLVRNSRNLLVGGISSQLISLAALPAISRIYEPTVFGVVATWLFIGGLAQIVASLRLEYAVIRAKTTEEAVVVCEAGVWLAFIVSIVLSPFVYMILSQLDAQSSVRYAAFFQANVFLGAMYQLVLGLCLNCDQTGVQMRAMIIQVIVAILFQIGMGFYLDSSIIFLWGVNLGYLAGIAYVLIKIKRVWPDVRERQSIVHIVQQQRSDSTKGVTHAALYIVSRGLPVPMLTALASAAVAGQMAVVYRIVFNPLYILTNALGKALMRTIGGSVAADKKAILGPYLVIVYLIFFSAILLLVAYVQPLTLFVLGSEWEDAGRYITYFVFAVPSMLCYELMAAGLVGANRQGSIVVMRLVVTISSFGILSALLMSFSVDSVLVLLSLMLASTSVLGIYFSGLILLAKKWNACLVATAIGGTVFSYAQVYLQQSQVRWPSISQPWILAQWLGLATLLVAALLLVKISRARYARVGQ